ncbi:MAG: tetratricopeptide repeat protein [Oscillospiraceae bacterium]|nr:tetratricopeptide repeat protein [Oscillospiraceae bacterium]
MDYAGSILRRERLLKNWSQEGLCQGICTVSYLSKIEQGKAAPSDEIIRLLMEKLELSWQPPDDSFIENGYLALISLDSGFEKLMDVPDPNKYIYSPLGADFLILKSFASGKAAPLDTELEACLSTRQLAFQRLLQRRFDEAARLFPCGYFHYYEGVHHYQRGHLTAAVEALQAAYTAASNEGHPRVMLMSRMYIGNCYSNIGDIPAMLSHYGIAENIARALGDKNSLEVIRYNTASTQLEQGNFSDALTYFESIEAPDKMVLHKLALCYEKTGQQDKALKAVEKAFSLPADSFKPAGFEDALISPVYFRLTHKDYLKSPEYGELLLNCFARCRNEMHSGYVRFHLPWVIEWHEGNRQYKKALELLREFS